jgi:hypothetical protein
MSTPQTHRRITDAVWSSDLPPLQRLVMFAYLKYAHGSNGVDRVWASWPQLLSLTGMSRDSLSRALRGLEDRGWLVVVEPARQHRSTRYRLTDPSSPPAVPLDEAQQSEIGGPAVRNRGSSSTGAVPESLSESLSESIPPGPRAPQGSASVAAEPDGREPNQNDISARRAITTLIVERRLPFTVDYLLALAHQLAEGLDHPYTGNPFYGYMHRLKPATEKSFDGARDPTAVLHKRLGLTVPRYPDTVARPNPVDVVLDELLAHPGPDPPTHEADMTATSMQGDRPPSRVRHGWRCVKRGPLFETVRTDATGRARVVEQCQECGHDDMTERIRAERQEHTP